VAVGASSAVGRGQGAVRLAASLATRDAIAVLSLGMTQSTQRICAPCWFRTSKSVFLMGNSSYLYVAIFLLWLIVTAVNRLHWRNTPGERFLYGPTSRWLRHWNVALLLTVAPVAALLPPNQFLLLIVLVSAIPNSLQQLYSIWVRHRRRHGLTTAHDNSVVTEGTAISLADCCTPLHSREHREILANLTLEEEARILIHIEKHMRKNMPSVAVGFGVALFALAVGFITLPGEWGIAISVSIVLATFLVLWWRTRYWRREGVNMLFETEWARQQGYTRENVRLWKLPWGG